MSMNPSSMFEALMREMAGYPLWIKQALYAQLKLDLEASLSKITLDMYDTDNLLQLWVPEMTPHGAQLLANGSAGLKPEMGRLLDLSRHRKTVVEMCLLNQWSLEACAILLREAIGQQLLNRPVSGIVLATIDYLAGLTRLGEYLVNINRLNPAELEQALRTQRYIEESMGERTGIANVLINLGYIQKQDSEGILFLKQESKKAIGGAPGASPAAYAALQGQYAPPPTGHQPLPAPGPHDPRRVAPQPGWTQGMVGQRPPQPPPR